LLHSFQTTKQDRGVNLLNSLHSGSTCPDSYIDIICFQEVKCTRQRLVHETDMACLDIYECYYSFSRRKQSYSGVVTYCASPWLPIKAEEGFSGLLNADVLEQDRIGHYGSLYDTFTRQELLELDSEGRVMMTDHSSFVLLNASGISCLKLDLFPIHVYSRATGF
jgi:exonuclease III